MNRLTNQWTLVSGTDCDHYVNNIIKTIVCVAKNACNQCWACRAIDNNDHYQLLTIHPSKRYYCLEDIDDIKHHVRFTTDDDMPYFVVIKHMERMPIICANSMLKLLEEPPTGYFFIGLTSSIHAVLSTLRSRAHIVELTQTASSQPVPWCLLFTQQFDAQQGLEVLSALEHAQDLENIEYLDAVVAYWLESDHPKASNILTVLTGVYEQGISLGSGKIVWKNIFLQMANILSGL